MLYSLRLFQESDDLECLVRLLQLGLKSLRLIDTKEFYEDKLVGVADLWVPPTHTQAHTHDTHMHRTPTSSSDSSPISSH